MFLNDKFIFKDKILKTHLVTFVNPTNYYNLSAKFSEFDEIYSDGFLLTFLFNRRFRTSITRTSFDFSSIAGEVFQKSADNHLKVAIIGGTKEENFISVKRILARYPNLTVTLNTDGYRDTHQLIEELQACKSDIIICGMGSPKQEYFLIECKNKLVYSFIGYTCGGFITQTAISDQYYSAFVNYFNLRWLVRMIRHKHVRHKLLRDYPKFLIKWFNEKLHCK